MSAFYYFYIFLDSNCQILITTYLAFNAFCITMCPFCLMVVLQNQIIEIQFNSNLYQLIAMYSLNGRTIQIEVILNVYDLNPSMNQTCYGAGLGFYHSGIQISSCEYTFAGHPGSYTGVMEVSPKVNHPNFRESIVLGKTTLSHREINQTIDSLKSKFPGNSYDVVRKNCNTFTNCVSEAILKKPIPGWVNRMANMGKFIYETGDFIMNKPYNAIHQTSANALGVVIQEKQDIFNKGSGVMIG